VHVRVLHADATTGINSVESRLLLLRLLLLLLLRRRRLLVVVVVPVLLLCVRSALKFT